MLPYPTDRTEHVNKIPLFGNAPASLPRKSNPQAEVACPAEKGPFIIATQQGYDEDDGSKFKPKLSY
jgi:hypothetical protein